eukprot:CAMPEP_0197186590 /NCGR_PEP_ID=MMETSP1423-20130617/14220_1 /TAXON_ID=476441 /ORGANISM="Pseudo-nitzschia heimii, Strain UNC1101" /LENGTH=774 /DNA_ID=CAMNT_0042637945 /DNA_START=280 /DNA_END=2604 /DNA_ORIENTATION=-
MDLHCVICYEEFNLTDHYPVVLPCGHTYICVVCAKRIKICHECREPLFWTPPQPQQPAINNHNSHAHRSPATSRYSRYNHSRYSPRTPPHPANGVNGAITKREEIPLPLPKNVVLMDLIEAKQRQERLVQEQKEIKLKEKQERQREKQLKLERRREERRKLRRSRQPDRSRGSTRPAIMQHCSVDSEEIEVDIDQNNTSFDDESYDDLDYDDEISSSSSSELPLGDPELVTGYAALSGTCGTYAVKEPEGLLVLPQDPNRPKYYATKGGDEKKEGSKHSNTHFSSIFSSNEEDDSVDSDSMRHLPADSDSMKILKANSTQFSSVFASLDDDCSIEETLTKLRSLHSRNEPFTIKEGQKVQVVGVLETNDQSVYQLARGAGFVVASANQLVKVGGPLESSCKMEGMLQSIMEQEQEMKRKLDEITNLASRLKHKIILEQDKPEEVPVISIPPIAQKISNSTDEVELPSFATSDSNIALANLEPGAHPTTPTRTAAPHPTSPDGGSAGRHSVASVDSTVVNLGLSPRTPSQTPRYYTEEQRRQFVYSPARSCPMPSNQETANHLNQPFLDDEIPSSTGVLRYRVNNDDETSGLGWAGVLGCGTSLFGERLLESSDHGAATNIFNTTNNGRNDILNLPFDQNTLMQQSNAQRRAAALAVAAVGSSGYQGIAMLESNGSGDSPLRRGGSFDGGGGINFRTGMSGHSGLGKTKRDFSCDQQLSHHNGDTNSFHLHRRRSMMSEMSQHRGAGVLRVGPRSGLAQRRGTTPDTLVGCQTIR